MTDDLVVGGYALALILQLIGAVLVARDIWTDQQALRDSLRALDETEQLQGYSPAPGFLVSGIVGAQDARRMARAQILEDFTVDRVQTGFRSRWIGALVVGVGVVLGGAASIASMYA
ncbi:hypothetical protein GIY30_02535 [Gordonia sp. HNM0687]|uniref:Uncharacterized protein n=1 Tax=Gordonia mangrovi TaxID=2665643 RepID=A0A6L7GL12_9ACTN|nr:hypothetical protein [Gordonia mangrovi]MXP20242.1 hypothetical protein [Gordonia mangrovi]UVF79148.1 hypothetical protein NWF22_04690 [Gordonia mangrovi]